MNVYKNEKQNFEWKTHNYQLKIIFKCKDIQIQQDTVKVFMKNDEFMGERHNSIKWWWVSHFGHSHQNDVHFITESLHNNSVHPHLIS